MREHIPRMISPGLPAGMPYSLYMPQGMGTDIPLIVRVTSGEDVTEEAEYLTRGGYAVYIYYANQSALETEPGDLAPILSELENELLRLLTHHPCLSGDRVYLDGWLTAYAIFHTDRFKAAVQRPALINPATAYGNCAAGRTEKFGDSLGEMLIALADRSVLRDVDDCSTPCLVIYTEGDPRYSREQSEQLYSAMKDRNPEIPCRMAVFPSAYAPGYKERLVREITDWFARFGGGE